MRNKISTNIRLNLDKEADRRAWEYLQNMDRKKYKSYSSAIVTAVNDYFDRQERIKQDHYLETRDKEDAFLDRIITTIENGLKTSSTVNAIGGLLQLISANTEQQTEHKSADDNSLDDALDFTDNF
ncbi:MAG: hypothetical protein Q4G33_03105 [bacterium]|nr:hypothetical protein [bacterium]